jgi:hypothetical protein
MIGRLFSLAHDRWINLSHRQKLAFRSEFLAVVSERKKAADHNTCWQFKRKSRHP